MLSLHSRARKWTQEEGVEREFDAAYQVILSGKGVRTDEEELTLLGELIRRAEQGSFPQGGAMHIISPEADVDWSSDAALQAVAPRDSPRFGLIAGSVLIGIAMLFALFSLFSLSSSGGTDTGKSGAISASEASMTSTALAAISISETLSVSATQTAIVQDTISWADLGVVVGTDYKQKLPPVHPETIEIDGIPFRVYPSLMDGGTWEYQPLEGTASWIAGTVINWSFGVPDLDANVALFKRLTQAPDGKDAFLRMSGGIVRHFRLQKPVQIERQQIEHLLQNQPGITIVLLGTKQGLKRWVVRGVEIFAYSN